MAAVYAIADLAQSPAGEEVMAAYGGQALVYGKDYVIPKPFDPRLISTIPVAVAKAAMESGVARRPIENLREYQEKLALLFNKSAFAMKPIIERARANPLRVALPRAKMCASSALPSPVCRKASPSRFSSAGANASRSVSPKTICNSIWIKTCS